jgi:hypothetical protein
VANGDVEQGGRHHMAQRLVVHRPRGGNLLALLREFRTLGLAGTLELSEAVVESGKIGRSSARRRCRVVQGASSLVGLCAQTGDVAAQARCGFLQRIDPRHHGRIDGRLACLGFDRGNAPAQRVDGCARHLRSGRRRLHRRPAQHPADRDHDCGCDSAGERSDNPG